MPTLPALTRLALPVAAVFLLLTVNASAASPDELASALVARNCLECHNGSDRKGGLDLTRRETALKGGDTGPALDAGHPDRSLLVERIEQGEMPPEGRSQLTKDERALLRQWVADGAKWSTDPIDPLRFTTARRAGYDWWSLAPIKPVAPPSIQNPKSKIQNPIDAFIHAKLAENGLEPSPPADRRTLIRRLSFDLIGLPPTPAEVEAFAADQDERAYERLVDRLLDSPHYGERWARHWLDIVRYGETQGFERNKLRPSAWKYRDFVVEAFNADLPYDDFIRWQIAGDVLRPDDPLAVAASGFLVMGPYDLTAYNNGTLDMRAFAREEELEGLVGVVCQAFLGLTVNCSRCHDHKFDPLTQREFYQISAALGGIYQGGERESLSDAGRASAAQRVAALKGETEKIDADDQARRSRLESLVRLLDGGPVHAPAPKQPEAWRILARGDFRQPGEVVSPRGIAAIAGPKADWGLAQDAPEAERRKALAEWIAHPDNPLTPRVIVNRLWAHHFGAGLVRTPSDFGFQGGQPSHPELLDWLAGQLVRPDEGPPWRLKRIQRLIVLSATYRQSSNDHGPTKDQANPKSKIGNPESIDADNRLLWRQSPRRLEAETFRDAVLDVSGDLDRRLGGPGYRDFTVKSAGDNENYTVFDAVGGEFNRRSLYRTAVRAGTSPLLDLLDCPDPSVPAPRRSVTTTPIQALSLLNNKFMEHSAQRFAERLEREAADAAAAQIRRAYALAFARQPDDGEIEFSQKFVAQHGLKEFCLVLFNASEFLYVD
jgi:mono/diheme cytochrome c family protein